jgi:hypothetical protein
MAPIYTARHISSSDRTVPLFTIKNLPNLAPSTLTSLNIAGVPLEKQVAFSQYADNIASFLYANSSKKVVKVTGQPLGRLSINVTLPLTPPPVQFILQRELDFEKAEKFVSGLGPGASKSKQGKTVVYHAPALSSAMYANISKVSSTHYNCGRNAVTPTGIIAYEILSTALAQFLKVHTYSAFTTPPSDPITSIEGILESNVMAYEPHSTKGKKGPNFDPVEYSRELSAIADKNHDEGMDMGDDEPTRIQEMRKPSGMISTDGVDVIFKAKPSVVRDANIGSSNSVPKLPGLVFPYFHGLIQPDHAVLNQFILKHLFQLLGKTQGECQQLYIDIRRGVSSLATTDIGMVLSHIVLSVELALQTQARVFLIIHSNTYHGFVLLGTRFAIFDSTRWLCPLENDDLLDDLADMDPHESAVRTLVEKFGEMTAEDKYNGVVVSSETFGSPNNLVDVIKSIKLDKLVDDDERTLDNAFRALNYMGKGYLQQNPQIVAEILETFFSDATIELDRPTYFPSIRTDVKSREFALLSRFGPDAPSLWNERGALFKCEAKEQSETSVGGKRKVGSLDTYGNMPVRLLVTPKPLATAVKDLVKVVDQGGVKMDLKERAGKFKNMSVESEEMKKRIWKVLVDGLRDSNKKRKVSSKEKEPETENYDDVIGRLLAGLN